MNPTCVPNVRVVIINYFVRGNRKKKLNRLNSVIREFIYLEGLRTLLKKTVRVSATYIFRWQKHLSLRVVPRRQFLLRLHLFQLLPCARSKTFGDFVEPWKKKEATLTRLSRLRN